MLIALVGVRVQIGATLRFERDRKHLACRQPAQLIQTHRLSQPGHVACGVLVRVGVMH